jgi:hypothetical protein
MHHTFPCNCLIFTSINPHTTPHWQAYNLPADNEISERVGSSIIKPPKRSDVRINGQYFICQPNPPIFSSYLPRKSHFYSPFKRLLSSTHKSTTSTIITLISNRSVTICIHNPPSLPSHSTFYPLPTITPRDEVDRLLTSFSYPPHSFLFYSFNLYYFANPSSRRLRWRVAWRLPFFGTLLPTVQTSSSPNFPLRIV